MQKKSLTDEFFMKKALEEAKKAFEEDEVPVGAVIVCNNMIIGKGYNQTEKLNDVTAHAEMLAITAASNYLGSKYLENCSIYVTLEPCPMCAFAINSAHISALVYAAHDLKNGYSLYEPSIIHPKIKISSQLCTHESSSLLKSFFKTKRK